MKTYDANYVESSIAVGDIQETEDFQMEAFAAVHSGDMDLDDTEFYPIALAEGNEDAQLIEAFEVSLSESIQASPELAEAFASYQEARTRLKDRAVMATKSSAHGSERPARPTNRQKSGVRVRIRGVRVGFRAQGAVVFRPSLTSLLNRGSDR